jgi:hypothetical protein
VLQRQWKDLPPEEKARIKEIRLDHLLNSDDTKDSKDGDDNNEWMNKWKDEIEKGRQNLEDYMRGVRDEESFSPDARPFDEMDPRKRPRKRAKVNPLNKLKNVAWNPYDETLVVKKGQWRLDRPPEEEE